MFTLAFAAETALSGAEARSSMLSLTARESRPAYSAAVIVLQVNVSKTFAKVRTSFIISVSVDMVCRNKVSKNAVNACRKGM